MISVRSLAVVAAAAVFCAAGCSHPSAPEAAATGSSELFSADTLKDATIVKGTIAVGQKAQLAYEPDLYKSWDNDGDSDGNPQSVPFLAWEITTPAATNTATSTVPATVPTANGVKTQSDSLGLSSTNATIAIDLQGNFPGSPTLLVVDESFNVLGSTKAHTTDLGDVAHLIVNETPGKKFVLVRDMEWVLPMSFDITVAQ